MKKNTIKSTKYLSIVLLLIFSIIVSSCTTTTTTTPTAEPVSDIPESTTPPEETGIKVPATGESPVIDKALTSGTLRVGVAVAPPWLLQDPATNQYFGPAVDIVDKVASLMNVKLEYVDTAWDVLIAGLQADKFDIAIAPMFATEARMEVIDFVNYTTAGTCYFVKADNTTINSLDDLNNPEVTIVTYTGTGNEEGIKKAYPNATLRSIVQPPGGQPPIEEIQAGRGDVGHFDSGIALLLAAKYPDLRILGGAEDCIANPDIPFPIGLGINKGDPALTSFLQAVVDSMQDEINANILKYSDPQYLEAPEETGIKVPATGESPVIDKALTSGTLRVGVAVAPPWLLQDPATNQYFGPAVDIVDKVASLMNVKLEYVDTAWDVLIAGLQADKFDIAIAPMFATEARMEVIDFVNYTTAGTCYFVKADNTTINSLDDLNNPEVTIVTYTGTGNEEGIKKAYPNATLRSIVQPPGGQPPIEEIQAGRGDVGHFDSGIALLLAAKYPDLRILGGAEDCIANPDIPFPIGLGINKGDPALTSFLQAVVDSMQDEINANILKYSDPQYLE